MEKGELMLEVQRFGDKLRANGCGITFEIQRGQIIVSGTAPVSAKHIPCQAKIENKTQC